MSSLFLSSHRKRKISVKRRIPLSLWKKRSYRLTFISRIHFSSDRSERRKARVQRRIERFVKWCSSVDIDLHPHLCITREGTCDEVGVVATGPISKGECVASIPRAAILSCANVRSVADRVVQDHTLQPGSTSSWLPLLLTLASEYSKKKTSKHSRWQSYLSLVPSNSNPAPMLWFESVRRCLLEGTSVDQWVRCDQQRMREDYDRLAVPFMKKNKSLFNRNVCSYEVFEKLTAFVMAYSFTDEGAGFLGQTMMVPFVDLLNHSSRHHVELTFHPNHLQLQAVRDIKKGEEVMNTYGSLSNAELLHKYGFTELSNPYDEAVVPCQLVQEVYLKSYPSSSTHWDRLHRKGVVEEEYGVGPDGTPNLDLLELVHRLTTLAKITTHRPRRPTSLRQCTRDDLQLLNRLAQCCLDAFPEQVTSLQPLTSAPLPVGSKGKFSLYLALGQQTALRRLLKNTSDSKDNA